MKLCSRLLALVALPLAASSLSAQVSLVSWGPSTTYVTSNQTGQRSSAGGVIGFNLATPLTPAANYTGGAFYGGASATASMNGGFTISNNNATNGGGNDTLLFGKASSVSNNDVLTGVFLWKQADFLAGSSVSDNVAVTSFSYTGRVNGTTSGSSQARFVIQQGSTYMISDNVGLNTASNTYTLSSLSSVGWYSYNPVVGLSSIDGLIESPSFGGVTAAGLYLTTTSTGTNAINLAFSAVSISGTVSAIPEPGAGAALAGLGSLACVALRRRRR